MIRGSVGHRLNRAFGVVLSLAVLSAALGAFGTVTVYRGFADVDSRFQAADEATEAALQRMSDAQNALRGYQLTGDRGLFAGFAPARAAALRALDDLDGLGLPDEQKALVDLQREAARRWFVSADAAASAEAVGAPVSAQAIRAREEVFQGFRIQNQQLDDAIEETSSAARQRARTAAALTVSALAALTLLGLAVGIAVAARTTASIRRPLRDLVTVLGRLTSGEESARASEAGPSEVLAVSASVNALAEESARLRRAEREQQRLDELASALGRKVRSSLDQQAVFDAAASSLGAELGADRAWMRLITGEELGPIVHQWHRGGLAPLGPVPRLGQSSRQWLANLHESGRSFVVHDTATAPELDNDAGRALVAATGAASLLMVPLVGGSGVVGSITLARVGQARRWRPADVRLAESAAHDIGVALSHARLFTQQQELVAKLRDLDRSKTDFLSTVSHELRTPLTSIAGYTELLVEGDAGPLTVEQLAMLETVQRNSVRLQALIADLLVLSRIESGTFGLAMGPVRLPDVVRDALAAVEPAARTAGVALRSDVAVDVPVLNGDAGQLERVLLNLLSNGVKFTPEGGSVTVGLRSAGPAAVELTVADTGIGIPESERGRLFTKFFRASNATERAIQGTGLGLTIVRSIVSHHGGTLNVASATGAGTTVTVRLPLDGKPAASASTPAT